MLKKKNYSTSESRIKSVFIAKIDSSWAFSRVSILIQATILFTLLVSGILFFASTVDSRQAVTASLGAEHTMNIFPSDVSSNGWKNSDTALAQDLPDYALYQEFDQSNSAVFDEFFVEDSSPEIIEPVPQAENVSTEPEATNSAPEESVEEESQQEEQEPAPELAPTEEQVSYIDEQSETFGIDLRKFPLAQLTLTSTTENNLESPVDETQPEETLEESLTENEETAEEGEQEGLSEEIAEESLPSSHEISFTDFSVPNSSNLQFLDGLQLRVSFAAKLKQPIPETLPYVEVLFGNEEDGMQSVGSILIDEEASNSMNGGYYLFPLPAFLSAEDLESSKVILQYRGDVGVLENIYLDALWLEVNTRVIEQAELDARGVAEALTHLEAPKLSVLLSDQLNFSRTETPIFNLRYESQQNFLVRGFKKLFGQTSFDVKQTSISHISVGLVPVEPEVTVASDGLVTIELPPEQLEVLPPGTYQVNILFEENGEEYTDTFNFEWGILTVNPDKTEYQVGETAKLSMGAISPNGNTLCEAILGLYVTDPTGYIARVPVTQSGECNGNNVISVPDYIAELPILTEGEYQIYLERMDETGAVIGFTTDSSH